MENKKELTDTEAVSSFFMHFMNNFEMLPTCYPEEILLFKNQYLCGFASF